MTRRRPSSASFPPEPAVEIELDQLDCPVTRELRNNCVSGNDVPGRHENPIVRTTDYQLRQRVELGSEPVDDSKEVESLKIRRRWFTIRTALTTELPVEVLEEVLRRPDDSATGHRVADSVRAIRSSIRARARATSSIGA